MFSFVRRLLLLVGVALQAGSLAGCGTLNERLAAGVSDAIPTWAGGLPADAPPRPGTAQYDEYMRERERQRLLPASERSQTSAASDVASGQAPQENR
jgi:hypothetical protein